MSRRNSQTEEISREALGARVRDARRRGDWRYIDDPTVLLEEGEHLPADFVPVDQPVPRYKPGGLVERAARAMVEAGRRPRPTEEENAAAAARWRARTVGKQPEVESAEEAQPEAGSLDTQFQCAEFTRRQERSSGDGG